MADEEPEARIAETRAKLRKACERLGYDPGDFDQNSLDHEMYFGRDGRPLPFSDWAAQYQHTDHRVAYDEIGLCSVSTVWFGINNALLCGPPMIFETTVFRDGSPEEFGMRRYATEQQALAGHEEVCAEIRERNGRAGAWLSRTGKA